MSTSMCATLTIKIVNSSGTVVVEYTYDAWGNLLSTSGTMAASLGVDNPFRYRGYYYDAETGLYYLNSRYYNPNWGRFINADSVLGQLGGFLAHNLFTYCRNNPVIMIDTAGRNATVIEFVQQAPWLAALWGIAVVEPTPFGELIAGLVTVVAYVVVQVTADSQTADTAAKEIAISAPASVVFSGPLMPGGRTWLGPTWIYNC